MKEFKKTDNLNLKNARQEEQIKVMQQIIKDGVCPFCEENLEKYHPKPILFKTSNWIITTNAWPYQMTQKHFLVISRQHINHSAKITPEGWQEIGEIIERLEKEYGLDYGTFLMRFGDMDKTGATVKHLHFQLVQSNPDDPNYDPQKGLSVRIG